VGAPYDGLTSAELNHRVERYMKDADKDLEISGTEDVHTTPENLNEKPTAPRPILRIQSKVMDFYVDKDQDQIVAYYVMISAYLTRFKRQNVEQPLAQQRIHLHSMADADQSIYVLDPVEGYWKKQILKPGQSVSFKTNNAGKFPFAVPSDGALADMAYIRLRMDAMPDGLW
jgi:hypothetical protein